MEKKYPEQLEHIKSLIDKMSKELPGTVSSFSKLHKEALAEGALSTKMKELIALGIGISAGCEGCISYHTHDALTAGASRQEILETIGVAILMGGGPSMIYGAEAMAALDQFEARGGQ